MSFWEWKKGRRQFDVVYADMSAKLTELDFAGSAFDEDKQFA